MKERWVTEQGPPHNSHNLGRLANRKGLRQRTRTPEDPLADEPAETAVKGEAVDREANTDETATAPTG